MLISFIVVGTVIISLIVVVTDSVIVRGILTPLGLGLNTTSYVTVAIPN